MANTNTMRRALEPQPGALIAKRYEIDRLLARGGVGVVYVAHDKTNGREVVVKVLAAHLTGETEARARFDREVERLSSIRHSNIVEVLDHGYENGAPFLVMEYITGEPLLSYLNRKVRLTLAEFVPIAAQILKALGSAHEKGLMHRDIKPGNIMLTVRKGRANYVKLLDFGMAKLVEGERDITSEQILGTATYMAPEQVRGEQLTARVDVYACGLLFYRMLSGKLPFVADNNAALLYKQVHELPPPLASQMPEGHEAPPELLELIDRCLAKDPSERPADATELTNALVGCVPSHLFRLPLADGVDPNTAASSTSVLQDVSSSMSGSMREISTGSHKRLRRREKTRSIDTQGLLGTSGTMPGLQSTSPGTGAIDVTVQPERQTPWALIVLGVVAVAALVGFLALRGAGETAGPDSSAPAIDERRVAARLDQVDAMILSGEFERARQELEALGPALKLPKFATRASQLEKRLAVLVGLEVARTIEQRGDLQAAEKAYGDVLALDPGNVEARNGIARTAAKTPPPPDDPPDPTPKPRARPRDTKKSDKPEPKTETKTDGKSGDLFHLPGKKKDDSIFLPTGK